VRDAHEHRPRSKGGGMPVKRAIDRGSISRCAIAATGRAVLVWLVVAIIASAPQPLDGSRLLGVSVAAAIWMVALRAAAAGSPYVLGAAVPAAIGSTIGLVCVAAINPYLPGLQFSLGAQLWMWAGIFFSSTAWDTAVERTVKRRVLVVGSDAVSELQNAAERAGRLSFELVPACDGHVGPQGAVGPPDLTDLAPIVTAQRPDLIVLADEHTCSQAIERLLDITDRRFRVVGLTSFYEYAFGCVPVRQLSPLWFMSLLHVRQRAARRPSKRVLDIVVACVGILISLLLLPFVAIAIKCTPGPVFYRQVRVGELGRRFTMYKLRTMTATAEDGCGAVFAEACDPRCTAVGRLLRKSHLDELPQFWNVLKGDMSIVGPRPERPEHIAMLEEGVPFWSRRLMLKPGMTGWAQVQSGYTNDCASAAEKLAHDFWYMRHGNLAIDVAVCLHTVRLALEAASPRHLWLRTARRVSEEHAVR
jgi:exopolysaccharide biosynthesis polyprenyl glycosylphosphotransferase